MSKVALPESQRQESISYSSLRLTIEERRWLELNDMPVARREEILFGGSVDPSPYILNNVTGECSDQRKGGHTGFGGGSCPENLVLDGPCTLLHRFDSDLQAHQKRDAMMSVLRDVLPGAEWSSKPWDFVKWYKLVAPEVFEIRDSSFDPYRLFNFTWCYGPKVFGKTYTNKENLEDVYRHRIHCCEPGCLDCRDRERRRLAGEKLDALKSIIQNNPGCPGVLEVVFTLPESVEHLGNDPKTVQRLMEEEQKILKKLFGVSQKSNLGMIIENHPVGDRDLLRDRCHQHLQCLPGHVVKEPKTGVLRFEWLEPVKVSARHTKVDWSVDLPWLRGEWKAALERVFEVSFEGEVDLRVAWVPYNPEGWIYKKKPEEWERIFFGVLAHKLKYGMRGWGKDVEKSVLRTDKLTGTMVLKAQRGEDVQWEIMPAITLVERFKWIKEHNRVSCRGFLQCLDKYKDVLGLVEETFEAMPDCLPADAEVEIIREKKWDRKEKKVKWVRDEVYRWVCPITGDARMKHKQEMKRWKA